MDLFRIELHKRKSLEGNGFMKYTVDRAEQIMNHLLAKRDSRIHAILKKGNNATDKEKVYAEEEKTLIEVVKFLVYEHKNMNLGKFPPKAEDLEQTILGALILCFASPDVNKVMQVLRPEHFYSQSHQQIFSAVQDLHQRSEPVDPRTVVHELKKKGHIESVGGAYYIFELTSFVYSAANAEYHTRVIIEYAIKRFMIETAGRIMIEAHDDTTDVFELFDAVKERIQLIENENIKPIKANG
jgi:hypothetical protein